MTFIFKNINYLTCNKDYQTVNSKRDRYANGEPYGTMVMVRCHHEVVKGGDGRWGGRPPPIVDPRYKSCWWMKANQRTRSNRHKANSIFVLSFFETLDVYSNSRLLHEARSLCFLEFTSHTK